MKKTHSNALRSLEGISGCSDDIYSLLSVRTPGSASLPRTFSNRGGVNWHKQDMAQPAFNRRGYGNQGFGGGYPGGSPPLAIKLTHAVSKSVLWTLYSVKKYLIDTTHGI